MINYSEWIHNDVGPRNQHCIMMSPEQMNVTQILNSFNASSLISPAAASEF